MEWKRFNSNPNLSVSCQEINRWLAIVAKSLVPFLHQIRLDSARDGLHVFLLLPVLRVRVAAFSIDPSKFFE
jgi:hypothetical protein